MGSMLKAIENIPTQIEKRLKRYQNEGVDFCIDTPRCLLNLPAGSGKTLIALTVAEILDQCFRVLIISPSFLRLNWMYEIEKWFPRWCNVGIIYYPEDAEEIKNKSIVRAIVGYSYFEGKKAEFTSLLKQRWDLIICDESQKLRSWKAHRTQNIIKNMLRGRERLIFMSATPLVRAASDLHPVYSIIQPGKWGTYLDFGMKYCKVKYDPFSPNKRKFVGIENRTELKERAKEFVFTRKKSVILKELPPKQVIDIPIDIGTCDPMTESLEEMFEREDFEAEEFQDVKTEKERVGLMKVEHILEFIKTFKRKEQMVIFAWHRSVIKALYDGLKDLDFKPRVIMGSVSEKKRMMFVRQFTNNRFSKLICSIGAGSLGLNLQCANIGIHAELPYSYADLHQCEERIHRIGSKKHVKIYKFIAVKSLDVRLNEYIEEKKDAADGAGVLV